MENTITERIKEIRTQNNIASEEMARILKIDTSEYLKLENDPNISCENVKAIAKILNVNVLKKLYDVFEYKELQEKEWFISMINEYTAPHIIIREENEFIKNYYDSLKNSGK